MKKLLKFSALALSTTLLGACGGGGGSDGSVVGVVSEAGSDSVNQVADSCVYGSLTAAPLGYLQQSRGFVVPMWSYTNHDDAVKSLTSLKNNTNANTIIVDFHLVTSNLNGNDIAIQKIDLIAGLKDVLQVASCLGFDVWLKPLVIVGSNGTNWKDLAPTNAKLWFENYSSTINKLAEIISPYNVSHYLITNELYSMTTNYEYTEYWKDLITNLKKVYNGKIGFNAGGLLGNCVRCNEFLNIPTATLSATDFLGISSYPRLLPPQVYTSTAVMSAWKNDFYGSNLELTVNNFVQLNSKMPIYFTELGSPAYYGGNLSPTTSADLASQKNFYLGSLNVISQNMPKIDGVFVYDWTLNSQNWVTSDRGFKSPYAWDIYNKPEQHSVFSNQWAVTVYQK